MGSCNFRCTQYSCNYEFFSQTSELNKLSYDEIEDSIQKYVTSDYEKGLFFANFYKVKGKKEGKILKEGSGYEAIITALIGNDEYEIGKKQFL